jgi:hypothetical protein
VFSCQRVQSTKGLLQHNWENWSQHRNQESCWAKESRNERTTTTQLRGLKPTQKPRIMLSKRIPWPKDYYDTIERTEANTETKNHAKQNNPVTKRAWKTEMLQWIQTHFGSAKKVLSNIRFISSQKCKGHNNSIVETCHAHKVNSRFPQQLILLTLQYTLLY